MLTLVQWLARIEAGHSVEIDMGLSRVAAVAKRLALDFHHSGVVTVAGTNGKGTTCKIIEACCVANELSVGVYSSPHILCFNERVRINGQDASDKALCEAFAQIDAARAEISLTYFEYATLAGLLLFSQAKLDVVILEVGLGGRLDATNIIDADIAVLTSIGLDHQDYLGDTLEDIAFEKAGIVKRNKHCVVGFEEQYARSNKWIEDHSQAILKRNRDFGVETKPDGSRAWLTYHGLRRDYLWSSANIVPQNVITGLASLHVLHDVLSSKDNVKATALEAFLADSERVKQVIDATHLAGRAQIISKAPWIMLDVAHNEAAATYLREKISTFNASQCHMVVGMLKDKNIEDTIGAFISMKASWYCASLPGKRGEKASRLANAISSIPSTQVNTFDSVEAALKRALEQASNTDMIVVFGSFITVAGATDYLNEIGLIRPNKVVNSI
ncbi:bifunctional tetrahydrofolate synthase/dihydrofolate synthase [Glaciecola sp. XM2]|uniref:bifunctional tetrahydrofolate synthase/dihydrofolate synthase n=1 Tax=Glaciecola sp. XM2 TaxID=1914931 RepID=UPI001BDE7E6D|nr:bifunctional tetrahydrofolate synthase/dihydrofolate synthase [Glaciecola sp. XM2]MBT1452089.1 bifunctional tetrahydrofolate synthase/dihydrofolate synthase [Glaciecola sp. XM2]